MKVPSTDATDLTPGEIYDILENPRRRFVLSYLAQQDRPIQLSTLAKRVAAWEADTTIQHVEDDQVDRVRASLYHKHVPRLREAGLVTFDSQEMQTVTLTGDITSLEPGLHVRQDEKLRDSYTT